MTSTPDNTQPDDDELDLGFLDSDEAPFDANDPVGRFTIPRVAGTPGVKALRQALRQPRDHRLGVVVTGPMGFGKSEGAHAAVERFADEQHRSSVRNGAHRRERVVYVNLRRCAVSVSSRSI